MLFFSSFHFKFNISFNRKTVILRGRNVRIVAEYILQRNHSSTELLITTESIQKQQHNWFFRFNREVGKRKFSYCGRDHLLDLFRFNISDISICIKMLLA